MLYCVHTLYQLGLRMTQLLEAASGEYLFHLCHSQTQLVLWESCTIRRS